MMYCRRLALLLVATGWVASGADSRADEAENLRRLAAMPLEHRRALAANLERFDAMESADREAIRALDRTLADQPDSDRARYLAVLRRYHLWLQRLPKEDREKIAAAPPEARLALVTKLRAAEFASDTRRRTPVFLQVVDLGDMSPFDVAQWLKIWFRLTPSQREKFEKMPRSQGPWRHRFLASLDPSLKIDLPVGQFTSDEEEGLVRKMMRNREFASRIPPSVIKELSSGRSYDATGNAEAQKSDSRRDPGDRSSPPGRNWRAGLNRRVLVHGLAGNYHFIQNPPEKVESSNLFRFLSALPKGISESFTYLPPEEARRRLTILYRLLYPFPQEMPLSPTSSNQPGAASKESTSKAKPSSPEPARDPSEPPPF